jgi:hypothetical protein
MAETEKKTENGKRSESGQAMTEYISMVAIFLGVALLLITLLDAFSEYGWRLLNLVGMDYP